MILVKSADLPELMKNVDLDTFNEKAPLAVRLALAVALAFTAYMIRSMILPPTSGSKFAIFYPAVMFSFYLGGNVAGCTTVILSALLGFHYLYPRAPSFDANFSTGMFLFAASICGYFISRMHKYRRSLVGAEKALADHLVKEANESLSLAVNSFKLGVWSYFPSINQVAGSEIFAEHFGMPVGCHAVSYDKIMSIIHSDDRDGVDRAAQKSVVEGVPFVVEHRVVWPDGSEHWIQGRGRPVFSEDGSVQQLDGLTIDFTDRMQLELRYKAGAARTNAAFASMNEGILIGDLEGNLISMNYAVAPFFRFNASSDVPKRYSELARTFDVFSLDGRRLRDDERPYMLALKGIKHTYELKLQRTDSGVIWYGLVSSAPIYGVRDAIVGVVVTFLDITDRVELQQNLEEKIKERTAELSAANQALLELSRRDALTGLHNRFASNERLQSEFVRMRRTGKTYGVLVLDIDVFKSVNDNFGHAVGDEILKIVADALSQNLREMDFIARWGGEEFLALLPVTEFDQAIIVAEKLRDAVEKASHPIVGGVTVSIGATVATPDDVDADLAALRADEALYDAKHGGRNRVVARKSLANPSPYPFTLQ